MPDITISTEPKTEERKEQPELKELMRVAELANKLEAENERVKQAIIQSQELTKAREMLSGKSFAGQAPPIEMTPEEKAKEEASRVLRPLL